MDEVWQKGNKPTVPVTKKETLAFYGRALSGGAAGEAAKTLQDRPSRIRKEVDSYKGGGMVKVGKGSTPYKCK